MTLLARWGPDNFIGLTGAPVPGLAVEIRLPGTTTKANLFTTSAGSVAAANPVIADDIGNASFYAAAGLYDFFANSRTISSVPVWPHPSELAVLVSEKSTFNVRSSLYGATGDGVTNDAPAIQAAINAAQAAGGGIVYLPPGTYLINSALSLAPNGDVAVDLVGSGMWNTTVKLGAAGARVKFSEGGGTTVAGQRGSRTGGFTIDGNNTATNGLFIGLTDDRTFDNIWVKNCTGPGYLIEQAQNLSLLKLVANNCGVGAKMDYGASGNVFVGFEAFDCGLPLQAAASSGQGCRANRFYGGLLEHFGTAGAPALTKLFDSAGADSFLFDGVQFSAAPTSMAADTPLIYLRTSTNLRLTACILQGNNGGGTNRGVAIDADGPGTTVAILDRSSFVTLDCAYKLTDSTYIVTIGDNPSINVTQRFRNQGGGTAPEANLLQQRSTPGAGFAVGVALATTTHNTKTGEFPVYDASNNNLLGYADIKN